MISKLKGKFNFETTPFINGGLNMEYCPFPTIYRAPLRITLYSSQEFNTVNSGRIQFFPFDHLGAHLTVELRQRPVRVVAPEAHC